MPDPELTNNKLYNKFPEGWSPRAVGSALYLYLNDHKIYADCYADLCISILNIEHNRNLTISMTHRIENDIAYVNVIIETANGKKNINTCYDICLKINAILKDIYDSNYNK